MPMPVTMILKRPAADEDAQLSTSKKVRLQPIDEDAVDAAISPPSGPLTDQISIADTATTSRSTSRRPKRYVCSHADCAKAFDRPVRLEAHQRTHTDDRPFACSESGCTKAFFKAEHLKAHVKEKHSHETGRVCTYVLTVNAEGEEFECGKTFPTAQKLKRHLAVHEKMEELKCEEVGCGQVFRKMETLQRHIKKDHLNEKAFRCTKPVKSEGDGTGGEEMEEECGQTFRTVGQLKAHQNREHAGLKFACEICSSPSPNNGQSTADDNARVAFATYSDLQAHVKAVHPPTCPTCGTACESNRALEAHMDIEHGSLSDRKTFKCDHLGCDRAFTKMGNLTVHVKNVHKKNKPFTCGQFDLSNSKHCPGWDGHGCGMGLVTKAALENHTRTQHLSLPSLLKRKVKIKTEDTETGTTPSSAMSFDEPPESGACNDPSNALSLLTGFGYADSRPIACWNADCSVRFKREFDLAQHMELEHEWNVEDINERLAEQEALEGGQFWIGGQDEEEDESLRVQLASTLNLEAGTADAGVGLGAEMDGAFDNGLMDLFGTQTPALHEAKPGFMETDVGFDYDEQTDAVMFVDPALNES